MLTPKHILAILFVAGLPATTFSAAPPDETATAAAVDAALWGSDTTAIPESADDAVWLRRVMLDIVGRPATPAEITAFGLDPDPSRKTKLVDELLDSEAYGQNWTFYWRDAIFRRATNMRAGLVRPAFTDWMAEQLNSNRKWDQIVTDLITFTGPANENGASTIYFVHEAVPEEVAAEVSRLFLGIQIQCANCHDHPWDSWKREQFHQFTAFFPRVSLRRDRDSDNMFEYEVASVDRERSLNPAASDFLLTRIDRNRDKQISEQEAKGTQLARVFAGPVLSNIDRNGDKKISFEEIKTARPMENRPGQGSTEHYMPDLADPASQGTKIDPKFFLNGRSVKPGLVDAERRDTAADYITAKSNPWFARAVINRVWYELTGTAFYQPIDDIGPDRECQHPEALEVLTKAFMASNYDLKWLIRTITRTRMYQRAPNSTAEGFARCEPIRMRSDQLYAALCQALNVTGLPLRSEARRPLYEMSRQDPGREEFGRIFGFDPSTPREELTGSIPEALFLMNSRLVSSVVSSRDPENTLSLISRTVLADEDIVAELYLTTVGREPTDAEVQVAASHIAASDSVREGLEDIFWALLNSPEFSSRR